MFYISYVSSTQSGMNFFEVSFHCVNVVSISLKSKSDVKQEFPYESGPNSRKQ